MSDLYLYVNLARVDPEPTQPGECQTTPEQDPTSHTASTHKRKFGQAPDPAGNKSILRGILLHNVSHRMIEVSPYSQSD